MTADLIREILATLPQRAQLKHDNVKNWLRQTHEQVGDKQLLWHLKRQIAVGGSEVGTLLLEAQGLTPPFGRTGATLAAEKLFRLTPDKPPPHMMRGIKLESPLKEAILKIYGGSRDVAAEQALQTPCEDSPQSMAGNTDMYWTLNDQRILVDTKVPMSATEAENTGSDNHKLFTYKSQVHHYDILGEARGFPADRLVIAELDVPVELAKAWTSMVKDNRAMVVDQMVSLLKQEKPGMRVNFIEVEPDLSVELYGKQTPIRDAIVQVCDDFMTNLVNGDVRPAQKSEQQPPSGKTAQRISVLESRIASLNAMTRYAEEQKSLAYDELKDVLSKQHVDPANVETSQLNIKGVEKFDMDSAVSTLARYSIDVDSLSQTVDVSSLNSRSLNISATLEVLKEHNLLHKCIKDPGYDIDKVKHALESLGESPETFAQQDYSFRVKTNKDAKVYQQSLIQQAEGLEEVLIAKHTRSLLAEQAPDVSKHPDIQPKSPSVMGM
ncbi:hypothetical protein [Marinobacterium stanieri]|uniref:YqaJ-like recombinase domain-containing protein n=1 Tax=Marinobacterium stanieri TaxID=49186 RepID=A0A1N6XA90_9GAMM|nr:hypothetical protein [Marinobacterium stanieri]SIQ99262.1 hypothetical protein SAMN05421647_11346 [Marinobacterium stanieri]